MTASKQMTPMAAGGIGLVDPRWIPLPEHEEVKPEPWVWCACGMVCVRGAGVCGLITGTWTLASANNACQIGASR